MELLRQAFLLLQGYSAMSESTSESDEVQITGGKGAIAPELLSDQPCGTKLSRDDGVNNYEAGKLEAEKDDKMYDSFQAFQSKVQLVCAINDWIRGHPERRVPVLGRHDQPSFEHSFAMEANLMATGERVWICRLGVLNAYQGWALELPNGSYVLVRSQYTRNNGHIYFPWIGGDSFEFASDFIANHKDLPKNTITIRAYARKRGLDPEDVLNEHDISHQHLEPEIPEAKQGEEVLDDSMSSLTTLTDEESGDYQTMQGKRCPQFPLKSSAGRFTRSTLQPKSHSKFTKPVSKAKRKASAPLKNIAAGKFPNTQARSKSDSDTMYPIESDTAIPDESKHCYTPTPDPGRSGMGLAPQYGPTIYPTPPQHMDPYYNQKPSAPPGPFPISNVPNYHGLPSSSGVTTFHFYLSDPSLGAIPKPYTSIASKEKLFKEAIAAHQLLRSASNSTTGRIIAASALVIGVNRPIVVRKDAQGKTAWEELKRVVDSIEKGGHGAEVEVTCILGS
ncbi:MAG: hypothetical protein LQ352_002896 [Teloschistes flavicans]|nr:MAG: hypothetical protein LQ352_002896 [Teloschistes flavicans]